MKFPVVTCFITMEMAWSSSNDVSQPSAGITVTSLRKIPRARTTLPRTCDFENFQNKTVMRIYLTELLTLMGPCEA